MTTKPVSFSHSGTACFHPDDTADVLRQKLTAAEENTQQLMKQLEQMGFSSKLSSESHLIDRIFSSKDLRSTDQQHSSTNYVTKVNSQHSHTSEMIKDSNGQLQQNCPSTFDASKIQSNKSYKHRVIAPFSSRTPATTGNKPEGRVLSSYAPRVTPSFENGYKKHSRSDIVEAKTGQRETEQELVQMKQLVSRLEEEMQSEIEDKTKAKEEAGKLRAALSVVTTTQAELEMKVEELTLTKQKLTKKMTELKEDANRESGLRSTLEESHATLLSRLQDMESVLESLRAECKTHSANANSLKAVVASLKDEVTQETSKRHRIEESYRILAAEKDKLQLNSNNSQSETQRVFQELTCLQVQYSDLVRQLDQTRSLIESLTTSNRGMEEEIATLLASVKSLSSDYEKLKTQYEKIKESETRLAAEKSIRDDDFTKQRTEREKLMKENCEKKQKMENLEQQLKTTKQNLIQKNLEFASAADGLELELSKIKNQLEVMECEKQKVLKDKESLLEEVNHTVDTLMSERSRLHTELQSSCVETESLRLTCSRLELDKSHLLEKLDGLQRQQSTQRKVEVALNEMMEQKNKLAYENGKLHSAVEQLQQELADATREQVDIIQLRKLCEALQTKYTKGQQDISEYKILLQKLERQSKLAVEELERKEHQLKMVHSERDDAERAMEKLLAELEVLKGKHLHKAARYDKNIEEAKSVNKEITGTLEAVMTSHGQLQNIVENLQVELGKRDIQISQLKASRKQEQDEIRRRMKNSEEKIEALKRELKSEQEKVGKKAVREVSEVCKQNDNLSSRNQDLLKANSDLRHKLADLDNKRNEMKKKLAGQKHKLQYLLMAKKHLEENLNKMKAVREDIEELERMRGEYMQKNKEQGETISTFMHHVTSLQDEVRKLASAHLKAQHLLRKKEDALEKERIIRDEMREKYTEVKKREEELSKRSHSSEEKLKEAHSESLEISRHLEEANDLLKGKFDKLQAELVASRQIQAKLEMENVSQRKSLELERSRAQSAAERAKEMIQSSKQTINQLSDYA